MKILPVSLPHHFALTTVLICGLGFATFVVHAQTRVERPIQPEPAASLRAIITPSNQGSSIRVRFENQGHGSVHLQLRDSKGTLLHDEWQLKRAYIGDYDLSSLPNGIYTIELVTLSARHTETIRIELPEASPVTIITGQLVAARVFVKND